MELALVLRELWSRKRLIGVGLLVALVAAILSVYRLDGLKLKPRSLTHASASAQIFVDTPSTVLGNVNTLLPPILSRAALYANFMSNPAVLSLIGKQVGLTGDQIYAAGPIDAQQPRAVTEPSALKRNVQITGETAPYRLNFINDPNLPIIGIYAQAPTPKLAVGLATGSITALQQYVAGIESADKVPPSARVVIRGMGQTNGAIVNGGIKKSLAGMVFVGVFLFWSVLMLAGVRLRESWRASKDVYAPFAAHHANGNGNGNGNGKRDGPLSQPHPGTVAGTTDDEFLTNHAAAAALVKAVRRGKS